MQKAADGYEARHYLDAGDSALEVLTDPAAARTLALLDGAGEFRPLKSAPNLRRGWHLRLPDAAALRAALDALYPAMLGLYLDWKHGEVEPSALRDLLGRQSGMYAVTRKATDEQLQATVGEFCDSRGKCLKTMLWRIAPEAPVNSLPAEKFDPAINQTGAAWRAIPMLCHEACNLLVGRVREVVKQAPSPET